MRIPTLVLNRILPELLASGSLTGLTLDPDASAGPSRAPGRLPAPARAALAPRLTLRAGQVLFGRVLQVVEGGAILDLGGTRVRASVRAPMRVSADAALWLQVETAPRHGVPALRVLGSAEQAAPLEREGGSGRADLIASFLRANRLPVTAISRALVGETLRLGLPFSAEAFESLVRVTTSLAGQRVASDEVIVRAALLAHDRGLPVTEQAVRSLARVLGGPALVDLAEALARDARRSLHEVAGPAASRKDAAATKAAERSAAAARPAQSPLAPALRGLLRQLDTLLPTLRQSLPAPPRSAAGPGRAPPPIPALNEAFYRLGLAHELQTSRLPATSGQTPTASTAGDGLGAFGGEGAQANVKASLLSLVQHEALPEGLRAKVDALADHITGRQLLMRPQGGETLSSVIIPLPAGDWGRPQSITVWGRFRDQDSPGGEGESSGLDLKNCRIVFDLDLPKLGSTVVDVHVVNRAMQVQVMTAHPEVEELLHPQRKELARALSEHGFHLTGLESAPLPQRSESGGLQSNGSAPESAPLVTLSPHSGGVNLEA